ncbi:hypothetical protein DL766_000878 [Monosporascus sp. MC13-8B]|uniref:3-phytase n=1 Tax=Monosporascus cannonballus TaxID=155416 RepID=A0ABY0GV65_9PEZI|nr:hypothetical protein DL762_010207 [Monosporascus cannonballus]RYO94086.1 hypothetical protein DL763_004154 [Monosporascus cannonballus]RYP38668.1 hypothetical protein DL766_000878 [Monosporascus sp. MC13-8B]
MHLKGLLASLASLPLIKGETVLGVFIFHRHGDRTPKSHTPVNMTALGARQVFESGNYYRNRYVASDSSTPIFGLSRDIAVTDQMDVTSPVDTVLQNSAQAFLQGLYPPIGSLSEQRLANDSSVEAPLGGYQYIPVNSVSTASSNANSENNEWLQGGSGCGNAMASSNSYFASSEYHETLEDTRSFYSDLLPVINGTFTPEQANYKNAYVIFDLINVATIHNTSIPSSDFLTDDTLRQLQVLANIHQWNLAYNSTDTIRAIAGSVLAAQIVQHLNGTLTGQSPTLLGIQFGAYASFMSFFGLAQLQAVSPDFMGIVDYASSMVFELVTNATASGWAYPSPDDVSVRFLFANGTAGESPLTAYPLFGQSEITLPWATFASEMSKFALGDTAAWCIACGNTTGVCANFAPKSSGGADAGAASTSDKGIPTPVAGVIGALVTLVAILGLEVLAYALSGLRLVKKSTLLNANSAASGAGIMGKANLAQQTS